MFIDLNYRYVETSRWLIVLRHQQKTLQEVNHFPLRSPKEEFPFKRLLYTHSAFPIISSSPHSQNSTHLTMPMNLFIYPNITFSKNHWNVKWSLLSSLKISSIQLYTIAKTPPLTPKISILQHTNSMYFHIIFPKINRKIS